MTGPTYVDKALSNITQAWTNPSDDFIAEKIFPPIFVDKPTGKYWAYNKDNLRVPSSTLRTGRSETKQASAGKSLQNYGPLSEHALKDFITKDELDQTDAPLNVETDVVNNLNELMALSNELDLFNVLADTAIVTNNTTLSGTSQWNDYGNSTPFNDIKNIIIAQRSNGLRPPNTLFFSWEVLLTLADHPDLLDRVKWSSLGVITPELLVKLFAPYGIEQVFIGKVMRNTAVEGQTDALSTVWGKHFWTAYITKTPGLRQVNGGYTLRLKNGKYVDKWDEKDPKGEWVRDNDYFDQMLFASACFGLIKNAIA